MQCTAWPRSNHADHDSGSRCDWALDKRPRVHGPHRRWVAGCLIPNPHPTYRIPQADRPIMAACEILQQLYALETSSPDFLRVLYSWIRSDEDEQYSNGLEGGELTRLVDFLDTVCPLSPTPSPLTNKTFKALGSISISDEVFRQCLRKLRAICGYHMILPSSHIITGDLVRTGESVFAYGGFADIWEGVHRRKKVCIKVLRLPLHDTYGFSKVHIQRRYIFLFTEGRPVGAVAIFQRGDRVETTTTPKHRALLWCYDGPSPVRIGVDAKRYHYTICQQTTGRGQACSGKSFLGNRV